MGPVNRCNGQGSSGSGGICQKFFKLKNYGNAISNMLPKYFRKIK